MKAVFQWVAAGLLLPVAAQAQLGVRAGGNVAALQELWSRNAFSPTVEAGLGYAAGVYYRVPLGQHWAVVPELQFSHESQVLRREGRSHSVYYYPATAYLIHDYRARLSYLNLPVLLRRNIGRVYAELGPQVSWLLGGRNTGETRLVDNYIDRERIDQAATSYYHRWEAGICLGLGLRLPDGWGASVRAYQGLTSLTADPKDYPYLPEITPASGTQYRRTVLVSLTHDLFAAGPGVASH